MHVVTHAARIEAKELPRRLADALTTSYPETKLCVYFPIY